MAELITLARVLDVSPVMLVFPIGRERMVEIFPDQHPFTDDSMKEARAERAWVISESAKGTYVKPTKTTVESWLAEWLGTKARSVKPTMHRHYVDVLRPVRERRRKLSMARRRAVASSQPTGFVGAP